MSKTPDQWCDEGNTLKNKGQNQEAIDCYDEAINIDPNCGRAYFLKALLIADFNRETEAVELYKKAIAVGFSHVDAPYNMGIDLNTLGRREEAVEAYNQALRIDPKKSDAYRNKGNALMMLGRVQEAVDAYAKTLELKPNDYAVYADIGPLLEDLGRKDEAMKHYDICISKDPKNFKSNYAKGCLLFREGKYQEAIKSLEVALEANELHPGANYHVGSAYAALGNKDKAMTYFSKADRMKPTFSIQYCNRGQCYYILGRKKEALQDFLKAQELLETDKKTMLLPSYINAMKKTLKNVLEAEKNASETEAALQQLNQQDPAIKDLLSNLKKLQEDQSKAQNKMVSNLHQKESLEDVNELDKIKKQLAGVQASLGLKPIENVVTKTPDQWCDEGNVLKGDKKPKEAEKAFDEAINIDPNCGRAYFLKALLIADFNRETEAVELYKKAIAVGFTHVDAPYNMGIDLNALGRREEAVEAYNQALRIDPKKADAYRNQGNALMMLGRVQEAVDAYAKTLELNPNDYAVYGDIGPLLEDLGRKDEAMKYYDICISKNPKNFKSNYTKGCLLFREGKYQEAIKSLEVALEANELHPGANYYIGSSYIALGNKDKAMTYFSKADQMKPNFSIQYCNRGQIYFAMGQKEKGLEDFKKTRELLESDKKTMLLPTYINSMKSTLRTVLESETVAKQTEEEIKKLDQKNPVVQKFLTNIRKLQDDQNKLQNKVVGDLGKTKTAEVKNDISELQKLKEEFKKQFSDMQTEISQLKTQVKTIDNKVTEMKNQMEDLKEELANKMDDFNKKLNNALDKQDLSLEDKTKLKGYFTAFIGTFSSTHITAQVVDSGQVKLDVGTTAGTVLSFLASFAPFVGDKLSSGITSLDEFLHSQEMIKNARRMKGLAADPSALSQVIGKTGYEIVMDKKKQQKIIKTTDQELRAASNNLFQKIQKICENLNDKLDAYLYTALYKTPAERVGHNDANELIEKWIKGMIAPYEIEQQFIDAMLKEPQPEKLTDASPTTGTTKTVSSDQRSACCNMF